MSQSYRLGHRFTVRDLMIGRLAFAKLVEKVADRSATGRLDRGAINDTGRIDGMKRDDATSCVAVPS
jgi:hypothetical protein